MNEEDLHAYLKTQFIDLQGAKHFMWRWANEMNQELPGFGSISSRSLSAHCSAVLEGCHVASVGFCTNYLRSKYGPELYKAAWSGEPPNACHEPHSTARPE